MAVGLLDVASQEEPALCRDTTHAALAQRAAGLHALHAAARRLHDTLDLASTLDAVAQGVVEVSGFATAVVNLFLEDGTAEVVSVAGGRQVREALLGRRERLGPWQAMLAASEPWGALRFLDHRSGTGLQMYMHVPDLAVSADPDSWHPLDALFAPLTSPSGELIGALSVDEPTSGRRPDPAQRELLEIFAAQAAVAIDNARLYTSLKRREAELEHAATHDSLTGLPNRCLLAARLAELGHERRCDVAAFVIDLDGFKAVNDGFGHDVGDEVLAVVGQRLHGCVRDGDTLARTGGDEFVLLLRGDRTRQRADAVLRRLEAALAVPVRSSQGQHPLGASIGVAVGDGDSTVEALLVAADRRMYEAKRARRTC